MKKIIGLLVLLGAAAAGAAMVAKRRGQDIGEFAGEWADRAKEVAESASETIKDSGAALKEAAVDLRDELPVTDRS